MYQLHGAPLNAETVGGPGKNTLLPPPLSGPGSQTKSSWVSSDEQQKYGFIFSITYVETLFF